MLVGTEQDARVACMGCCGTCNNHPPIATLLHMRVSIVVIKATAKYTYPLAGFLAPALLLFLIPPVPAHHIVPQAGDGVVLLVPVVYFIHRAVGRAVVAGAVMPDSAKPMCSDYSDRFHPHALAPSSLIQCYRTNVLHPPVGHGFNEKGLVLGQGPAPGLFGGIVHRKDIVAIHSDGVDAITGTPGSCGRKERIHGRPWNLPRLQ